MLRIVLALFLAHGLVACAKKGGEAIVLEKEHIDRRVVDVSPSAAPTPESSPDQEPVIREMRPDEIDVDGLVMKKEERGTSKDPRAGTEEQWRVRVQMVVNGRQFAVRTDRVRYEKLKKGDRVKVKYSEGKYTGTVWGAEIVD